MNRNDKNTPMLSRTTAPRTMDDLREQQLLKNKVIQHSVVYGPEGCGKLTLVQCWLASIYGTSVHSMQRRCIEISNPGFRKIEIPFFASLFHVVVDAPTCNSIDKTALQQFVREISATQNVVSMVNSRRADDRMQQYKHKIIVIRSADSLSNGSQSALRDILEKQADACRVILLTRNIAHLMDVILSRCLKIKMQPDPHVMLQRSIEVCRAENISMPLDGDKTLGELVAKCRGNWRKLFGGLDFVKHGVATWKDLLTEVDEQTLLAEQVARHIDDMTTPDASLAAGLDSVRELTHSATSIGVSPSWLLSNVCAKLVDLHPALESALFSVACECDYAMTQGTQPVLFFDRFALEAALCIALHNI